MGVPSEGMLISVVYEYDGREGLNLPMLDDGIPAGRRFIKSMQSLTKVRKICKVRQTK